MKNRFLRFTFIAFLTGLTSVVMAFSIEGEQGVSVEKSKKMTSSEYFSKIRSNQMTSQISIADVLQARVDSKNMSHLKSVDANYNWISLGPNNMGGPTKAIIFDNQDASGNTLYAGSTSGGMWTSSDYGNVWEKMVMDDVLNVSTICQASDGTVYVGTGVSLEPAADKISEGSTIGKGIFKKSGDSFQLMAGTAPSGDDINGDWAFVQKLAVDGSGKLYAATNTGLMFFDGADWVYAKTDGAEDLIGKSCDVVIYDGVIVAAVAGNTYVSTGGFASFILKSSDEEGMLPLGTFGNIKYAIAQSNSNYIYASYVDGNGSMFNTYLSTDKGNTWRVVYPGGSSIGDVFVGQGLRNNSIAVDPTNEKVVYLGAYDLYKGYEAQPTGYYSWQQVTSGDSNPFPFFGESFYLHSGINTIVFNPVVSGNVLFGTDGGIGATKNGFTSIQLLNRAYNTTEYFTITADKFGTVLGGAQFNGVQKIVDNGSSQAFELLMNRSGGPSHKTGGYNHISFINPEFYVCSAEDGTFWRSEDEGVNIEPILGGINPGAEFLSPFLVWESPNNPMSRDSVEFIARKHYNAGDEIWATSNNYDFPFQSTTLETLDSAQSTWVLDLVSSKSFIAVEDEVYLTTGMLDYTASPTWWQIGEFDGIPTCMAYSKDANYLWVGTLEGRLFRFSNIARAYNEQTADISSPGCIIATIEIELSTTQAITALTVDPKDGENVIFTLGNYGNDDYVFSSNDGMSDSPSFESIQGNLPKMPLYASSFEVNNYGLVFVGTENGLFYTNDFQASSVNWEYEADGFGNVPIFAIKQQSVNWPSVTYPVNDNFNLYYPGAKNYGAIYLGTFGAGVYVTKDFVGFSEPQTIVKNEEQLLVYPNPAQGMAYISFESTTHGLLSLEIFDLSGKLVMNRQYLVNKGQTKLDINLYDLENGSYIIRMIDGLNKYQSKLVISK